MIIIKWLKPLFLTAAVVGMAAHSHSHVQYKLPSDAQVAQYPEDLNQVQSRFDDWLDDFFERLIEWVRNQELRTIAASHGMTGDPVGDRVLPAIDDPIAALGKKLFFSKSLGGEFDSACVTCHHPVLGGADDLSLSVGVGAVHPDLLGMGRVHVDGSPLVPRNAPTVFNLGLWDTSLFWDSRVESFGKEFGMNGELSDIRTPDVPLGMADSQAGLNLSAAQARFPVTSAEEMRTHRFEEGSSNEDIRQHLAARIGGYGIGEGELAFNEWLPEFEAAFGVSGIEAEALITFDRIAEALGEYERSMVFVNNPWNAFLNGQSYALNRSQKRGANLFLRMPEDGGAGCVNCHSGDLFSDGLHHSTGQPQIGLGKGDGAFGNQDSGLMRETQELDDLYRFRTPSLLNIEVTQPYGHAGAFQTLHAAVAHYGNPVASVNAYFNEGGWCQLPQFKSIDDCESLYPMAYENSLLVLDELSRKQSMGVSQLPSIQLSERDVSDLVNFLHALTDPCVKQRDCLAPWIPNNHSSGPDRMQLNARDHEGNLL